MSGWQGRITAIAPNNDPTLIEIAWDSITLKNLPEEFLKDSMEEGYDYATMFLGKEDVESTKPRDKERDVEKQVEKIEEMYHESAFDEQERQIAAILKTDKLSVTEVAQNSYFDYLQKQLQNGIILTGSETFSWEEKYVFGGWSKKEYEQLKKTQPGSTDKYELIKLSEDIDEEYGIMTKVKRVADKKQFVLPLWDLECVDSNSKYYEYVSDYLFWMANYR